MTKKVSIGSILIGGGEKIAVQSMATTRLKDVEKSINEATELKNAGCDVIRFSVLDEEDVLSISKIKKEVSLPIVADIHFDFKLAIKCAEMGADKIRINPGNLGGESNVKKVADALKANKIPVRVGSNSGSIEKKFLVKYGRTAEALVESALDRVSAFEKYGVNDIVISVKSSSVREMIKAYRLISKRTDYPLHVGVTEAGTFFNGVVKNSIGIGALLLDGIGDTIRVSLSDSPVKEIQAGKAILKALGLLNVGAEVIACPTCGRCEWDCMNFAKKTEDYLKNVDKNIKIAVMGCAVNGPGEAAGADLGIAGSKEGCIIFKKGKIIMKVLKENAEQAFFGEIEKCLIQK